MNILHSPNPPSRLKIVLCVIGSVFFIMLTVGALAMLAGCQEQALTEDATPPPGMEVKLDEAGNPVDIVRTPGPPGHPIKVTIRNHRGEVVEQETFTDISDVLRKLPQDQGDLAVARDSLEKGIRASLPNVRILDTKEVKK